MCDFNSTYVTVKPHMCALFYFFLFFFLVLEILLVFLYTHECHYFTQCKLTSESFIPDYLCLELNAQTKYVIAVFKKM